MASTAACPVCGNPTAEAFTAQVLGRYAAHYRFCAHCEYLYADQPGWLAEAYSSAIARADTGLVTRNLDLAKKMAVLLPAFFDTRAQYLDMAGGTGLFVRLMRDQGLDYYWNDPYCQNQHAAGFDAEDSRTGFEAVSAFEALEHMEDPMAFIAAAVARSRTRTLIFTTELHGGRPPPLDWWYYTFATGQHIAFFSSKTLALMAERLGCSFVTYRGLHIISASGPSRARYRFTMRYLGAYYRRKLRKELGSRTEADHKALLALPPG